MRFTLVAAVAALGGLLFGYDTGIMSGALLFIREVFHLGASGEGAVAGVALGGAALGAAAGGTLADVFGRRLTIVVTAGLFVAGALASALAGSVAMLVAGRIVVGIAIGVSSMLTPLYLAEMAPPARRGAIVSLNQLFLTGGILISYLVGYALAPVGEGWRWMLGLGAVPGLILGIGMMTLPESPRWLLMQGRDAEAATALRRLRGAAAKAELAQLTQDVAEAGGSEKSAPWARLFGPGVRRALLVGVALAIFQQVTGINTVIYFAPSIFEKAGLPGASAAILATAGVGAVNLLLTIFALRLVDRAGRRPLLIWGLGGMIATLLALAAGFAFGTGGALGWLTVGSLAAYVGFFAIGLGPVFWLLISEIFPLQVRGRAMSVASVANWGANLIVTATFLSLIEGIGEAGTFLMFAFLSVGALAFVVLMVPETKGRSLEQIEADLGTAVPAAK